MPKKKTEKSPTKQLQLRLPSALFDHLEMRFRQTGVEKQLQALAGLVALEFLGDAGRTAMIQYATRVSRGEVAWPDLVQVTTKRKLDPPDIEGLVGALESLARLAGSKSKRRRQA